MNYKKLVSIVLCSFCFFYNMVASEPLKSSLVRVQYMVIPDLDDRVSPMSLSLDIKKLEGDKSPLHVQAFGPIVALNGSGLQEKNSLVVLDGFEFSGGEKRYVGIFSEGAVIDRLPANPSDTLIIKLMDGRTCSVPLSDGPITNKYID